MKKTIDDIDVRGQRVLVRLDLNVPLDPFQHITDDRRIRAALSTIKKLIAGGGRLILVSHLGRPTGDPSDETRFSLAPVAIRLGGLLDRKVVLAQDCVGDAARAAVGRLEDGDVCLLENLRFHSAETIKDKKAAGDSTLRAQKDAFAQELARMADVYVNDAFGTCHRDNASMWTVPLLMEGKPRVIGHLVRHELKFLGEAVANPARPFVCLLGGAKVSDKLGVIQSLLSKCDTILVGGAMAFTFHAAEGNAVGKSLVEPDLFETARQLRAEAGDRIRLPVDSVVAANIEADVDTEICAFPIPNNRMGLDIGPKTVASYCDVIRASRTIVWNGPMGVFEIPPFDQGTLAMANAVADATQKGTISIIGGGDSAAAIDKAGLVDKITHISTGGGASLEFLEGKPFAAIDILDDA